MVPCCADNTVEEEEVKVERLGKDQQAGREDKAGACGTQAANDVRQCRQ